jgi:hypothetical protein
MLKKSDIAIRGIAQIEAKIKELRALPEHVTDKRKLLWESIKYATDVGDGDPVGDQAEAVHSLALAYIELQLEQEWAKYLQHFRAEHEAEGGN